MNGAGGEGGEEAPPPPPPPRVPAAAATAAPAPSPAHRARPRPFLLRSHAPSPQRRWRTGHAPFVLLKPRPPHDEAAPPSPPPALHVFVAGSWRGVGLIWGSGRL